MELLSSNKLLKSADRNPQEEEHHKVSSEPLVLCNVAKMIMAGKRIRSVTFSPAVS